MIECVGGQIVVCLLTGLSVEDGHRHDLLLN